MPSMRFTSSGATRYAPGATGRPAPPAAVTAVTPPSPPAGRPAGGQLLEAERLDDQGPASLARGSLALQAAEVAGDGLAARADHVGEDLVGERQGDGRPAAILHPVGRGELEE